MSTKINQAILKGMRESMSTKINQAILKVAKRNPDFRRALVAELISLHRESKLMSRQEKLLKDYRGNAQFFDELPANLQAQLRRVKDQETLEMDVDRWLGDQKQSQPKWIWGSQKTADKWKTLPKGWTDKSRKEFWESLTSRAPKHKVTQCIKQMDGKVDDPGAFCASLADRVSPGWRGKTATVRFRGHPLTINEAFNELRHGFLLELAEYLIDEAGGVDTYFFQPDWQIVPRLLDMNLVNRKAGLYVSLRFKDGLPLMIEVFSSLHGRFDVAATDLPHTAQLILRRLD